MRIRIQYYKARLTEKELTVCDTMKFLFQSSPQTRKKISKENLLDALTHYIHLIYILCVHVCA